MHACHVADSWHFFAVCKSFGHLRVYVLLCNVRLRVCVFCNIIFELLFVVLDVDFSFTFHHNWGDQVRGLALWLYFDLIYMRDEER